ncbi:unnamed protein product [Linum trigynum]|uniref:Uncharacterized protein n=1 Tax=Linum trigynum TaxID=586398 RepID=A0AAV2EDV8_9ROSI
MRQRQGWRAAEDCRGDNRGRGCGGWRVEGSEGCGRWREAEAGNGCGGRSHQWRPVAVTSDRELEEGEREELGFSLFIWEGE